MLNEKESGSFTRKKIQGKEWYIADKISEELDRDRWRNPPTPEAEIEIKQIQDLCTEKKLLSENSEILEQINQDFPTRNKRDKVDNYNIALAIACGFILVTGDAKNSQKLENTKLKENSKV